MREIKFRAWDKQKNILGMVIELSYSPIIHLGYVPSYVRVQNFKDLGEVIHYSNPDEIKNDLNIEQSTGLKDKNGVEIYENDIVKVLDGEDVEYHYYAYLEIRYDQGKFYFHNAYAVTFDDVIDGNVLDVEVMGNIHQNKNLLVDDNNCISPDDIGNDIHEFLHGGDK